MVELNMWMSDSDIGFAWKGWRGGLDFGSRFHMLMADLSMSADPLGSAGCVEVLCSPLEQTRARETLGPGGPTPTDTYPHRPMPTHTYSHLLPPA